MRKRIFFLKATILGIIICLTANAFGFISFPTFLELRIEQKNIAKPITAMIACLCGLAAIKVDAFHKKIKNVEKLAHLVKDSHQ